MHSLRSAGIDIRNVAARRVGRRLLCPRSGGQRVPDTTLNQSRGSTDCKGGRRARLDQLARDRRTEERGGAAPGHPR
eukprot:735764-Rhodomonas_salina.1